MKKEKIEQTPEMKKQIMKNRSIIGLVIFLLVGVPVLLTLVMGIRALYVYNKTINELSKNEVSIVRLENEM